MFLGIVLFVRHQKEPAAEKDVKSRSGPPLSRAGHGWAAWTPGVQPAACLGRARLRAQSLWPGGAPARPHSPRPCLQGAVLVKQKQSCWQVSPCSRRGGAGRTTGSRRRDPEAA